MDQDMYFCKRPGEDEDVRINEPRSAAASYHDVAKRLWEIGNAVSPVSWLSTLAEHIA